MYSSGPCGKKKWYDNHCGKDFDLAECAFVLEASGRKRQHIFHTILFSVNVAVSILKNNFMTYPTHINCNPKRH